MKTVKLIHLISSELEAIQEQIEFYQNVVQKNLRISDIDKLLESIIELDISQKLWLIMRSRIENKCPANGFTLNLKPSEAAVLFKICRIESHFSIYRLNVIRKYRNEIDRQLKSIV